MTTKDCKLHPTGISGPEIPDLTCSANQLTKWNKIDNSIISYYAAENLNIGGADINIFKLLGVHEQGQLVDLTGKGNAISSGYIIGFAPMLAFTTFNEKWRSIQKGQGVLDSAYIGYDFGEIKMPNGRLRYSPQAHANIYETIATIKIKQGDDSANRITKCRVERSQDGIRWYGVASISLPDDSQLHQISFKKTVPSRYWRLRPTMFNGTINDFWEVYALQLIDYEATDINNIEDPIFNENRDRDYAPTSIGIKGYYMLPGPMSDILKLGLMPTGEYNIIVHFDQCVTILGRPIVVGDIFELPSEQQYSPELATVKKYVEATDITWLTTGYTPGWQPTMQTIRAVPAVVSQEYQDVFGSLNDNAPDASGLMQTNNGNSEVYQDWSNEDQTVAAQSKENVPQLGTDTQNIKWYSKYQIQQAKKQYGVNLEGINLYPNALYAEDGIPPNGEKYTEGDIYPTTPSNGSWHRLTYTKYNEDIPARLYRFSTIKDRWYYMETDRRQQTNSHKPVLEEFLKNNFGGTQEPSEGKEGV